MFPSLSFDFCRAQTVRLPSLMDLQRVSRGA